VVRDTLLQRHLPQRVRAGVFAISDSFQNTGMVIGLALAPVLRTLTTGTHTLNVVAVACLGGAALAGAALLKRPSRTTLADPDTATVAVLGHDQKRLLGRAPANT
jgi:hypothetical protein